MKSLSVVPFGYLIIILNIMLGITSFLCRGDNDLGGSASILFSLTDYLLTTSAITESMLYFCSDGLEPENNLNSFDDSGSFRDSNHSSNEDDSVSGIRANYDAAQSNGFALSDQNCQGEGSLISDVKKRKKKKKNKKKEVMPKPYLLEITLVRLN